MAERLGQELCLLIAQAYRARTAYVYGHHQQAKQLFIELLPKFKSKNMRNFILSLRFLGNIAIAEGQFDEAHNYLQKASEYLDTSYYRVDEDARLSRSWGDLENAIGNPETALTFYQKALRLSTRLGMRKEVEELKESIREVESLLG